LDINNWSESALVVAAAGVAAASSIDHEFVESLFDDSAIDVQSGWCGHGNLHAFDRWSCPVIHF
jgi:hypothetical protein